MKKNNSIYLIGLLLIVALIASVALVMRNQEMRKGAAFAGADMYILNYDQRLDLAVGQRFEVDLFVESRNEAKVSQVRSVLCYGPEIELRGTSSLLTVEGNILAGFSTEPLIRMMENDGEKCVNFTITSSQVSEDLRFGTVRVARLRFMALTEGEGRMEIWQEKSKIVGVNPGSDDKEIEIGEVYGRDYVVGGKIPELTEVPSPTEVPPTGVAPTATPTEVPPTGVAPTATPTATPTPIPTESEWPLLSFKVSYNGLRNPEAVCGQDWPVDLIVMGGGETVVYTDFPLDNTKEKREVEEDGSGGEVIFVTGLPLEGFNHYEDLAIFLRGPMHLQMKYGVDGQDGFYSQSGGEITLTNDPDTSTFYDFSNYPMLAGDVTGDDEGVPDGKVDGRDFSYVKSKVTIDKTLLSDGERVNGDFDGDCWIGNIDLAILMLSLEERYAQLY